MQLPEQQLNPLGHMFPQVPQWLVLVVVSTQLPEQQVCPAAQGLPEPHWQLPLTQLSPGPQTGSQGTSAVQVPP
jgi:hypothetical protein